jgi:hypothetical protein
MRILYIAGESANWVINLCNEMCKQGHEVTCVVQQLDEYDKDNIIVNHPNLTRINVDYSIMFSPEKMLQKILALNKTFDIVYGSHTPVSPTINHIARTLSLPWGIMILDIPTNQINEERGRALQWQYWFDIMKYANSITFNTYVARDEYYNFTHQWFPDENVITYAVNIPERFYKSGIDIKGDYVVSAFRLTTQKNANLITRALSRLNLPLKQVVIGRDNGDLKEIKKIAENNNIEVIHKEMVTEEEKYELIKNSLCLVYPQKSAYIGGLSPWEGMIIGKSTIVSDYKVLHDMFGEHAIYVDPDNEEDLAKEIAFIYAEKRVSNLKMLQHYLHALDSANFKDMAKGLLKVFEKNIKGR